MRYVLIVVCILISIKASAQQAADAVQPEAATTGQLAAQSDVVAGSLRAKAAGQPVVAQSYMVSAAHPLAVQAGTDILAAGGTAADAMVVVQTVLGLVEPQSSGLGGGAFLVWYDAVRSSLTTLDGRETAPLAATPQLFQDVDGAPMRFFDAVIGGRSVGTPGTPALLGEMHRRWGKQRWASLFDAAIVLAEDGFQVSPRLAGLVSRDAERLARHPVTAQYFLPEGVPIAEGTLLQNQAYADTLRMLSKNGSETFYTGQIAQDIVTTVQNLTDNPGVLSEIDLAVYQVKERAPICAAYRDHDVCGMGPPSSGALTVGQILGMLEGYDLASLGPDSAKSWRLIGDASRLAFADRGRFIADSDFVPVPTKGLMDPAYLRTRAAALKGDSALGPVAPGQPTLITRCFGRTMKALSCRQPHTFRLSTAMATWHQ
jgi:gamma-glutamyltranspeptidase/glutathione hydrolase